MSHFSICILVLPKIQLKVCEADAEIPILSIIEAILGP